MTSRSGRSLGRELFDVSPMQAGLHEMAVPRAPESRCAKTPGRPDDGIMPALYLPGDEAEPMGHIITLLNKSPGYSVTPELNHMIGQDQRSGPAAGSGDPVFLVGHVLSEGGSEFSDILTATFPPGVARCSEDKAGAGRPTGLQRLRAGVRSALQGLETGSATIRSTNRRWPTTSFSMAGLAARHRGTRL